jgi:hypothetical protein
MIVDKSTGKKLGYNETLEDAQITARMNEPNGASTEVITDIQYERMFGRSAYAG